MKKTILIIISILLIIFIVILAFLGINNKIKENNNGSIKIGDVNGKYKIEEIQYEIPSFSINVQGLFHAPIVKETFKNIKTYEISANISDYIYVYSNTYKGIKVKDVIDIINSSNREYNKVIFKSDNGLQVEYLKFDISDTLFLVFEKDGIKYPQNKEVSLLNTELSNSYNITNIKTIYFE